MLRVGLTGGIGSGKSTVSAQLASLGAVVVDADAVAREVVEPGTPALAAIADRFGPEVLTVEGRLDRPGLGRIVFGDPAALARPRGHHPPCDLGTRRAASSQLRPGGCGGSCTTCRSSSRKAWRADYPPRDRRGCGGGNPPPAPRGTSGDAANPTPARGSPRRPTTRSVGPRLTCGWTTRRRPRPCEPRCSACGTSGSSPSRLNVRHGIRSRFVPPDDLGAGPVVARARGRGCCLASVRGAVGDAAATSTTSAPPRCPGWVAKDVIDLQVGVSFARGRRRSGLRRGHGCGRVGRGLRATGRTTARTGRCGPSASTGSCDPGRIAHVHGAGGGVTRLGLGAHVP